MTSVSAIRGTCLCGTVQWQAEAPFENLAHCHCSMCRKAHGAAFASIVGTRAKGFCFVAGKDAIARYRSSNQVVRCFCGRCGSVVPYDPQGKRVYVPLGSLSADPGVLDAIHIFVADKLPWYAIQGDAPQYGTFPESWNVASIEPVTRPHAVDASARDDGSATGSCLCGRVAYAIAPGPRLPIYHCHCSRCRKARAAAHATNTFVERARFSWLRGDDNVRAFKVPEAERFTQAFCNTCGSGMPVVRPDRAVVPAATLDTPIVPADQRHIFVASKPRWLAITDTLPQHAEYAT